MKNPRILFDFGPDDQAVWRSVDDVVMGGVSRGAFRLSGEGTGLFTGTLSLENNGGFASVRAEIGRGDLSSFDGLEIKVRGDGRTYQLRLRTDGRLDGVAYRASFTTGCRTWMIARIPFDRFEASFRGRAVPDAPPLDTSRIRQLSLMLADGQPGDFSLEIDHVSAWKRPAAGD